MGIESEPSCPRTTDLRHECCRVETDLERERRRHVQCRCHVVRGRIFSGRWREHAKRDLSLRATQREVPVLTVRDRVHGGVSGGPRGKDHPRPHCDDHGLRSGSRWNGRTLTNQRAVPHRSSTHVPIWFGFMSRSRQAIALWYCSRSSAFSTRGSDQFGHQQKTRDIAGSSADDQTRRHHLANFSARMVNEGLQHQR